MHNFRWVYLNGEFVPPSQAHVSVFDRGFIFGDGVYEVIPVFGRRLFGLPHHLALLERSLRETKLANALLRQQAIERGAVEAILVREGIVTEGAASNIFVVRHGVICTPPKGPFILPGITRDLVLELAAAHGLRAGEEPIAQSALTDADEIWLTS